MHILLDTHILLWWLNDDICLSQQAREYIENADKVYVSSASIWEASIKVHLGKLDVNIELLISKIISDDFIELPISMKHAATILHLPSHHRDPFDRILIAQALSEPLRFLTSDKTLKIYSELVTIV